MTVKALMPVRNLNLVAPMAHEATAMHTTDTAAPALAHEVQRLRAKLDAVRAVLAKYPRQCNGTPAKWNERYLNGDADAVVYRAVLELEAQL